MNGPLEEPRHRQGPGKMPQDPNANSPRGDRPVTPPEPDPFAPLRERMVRLQLAARDIDDPRVLQAMGEVPREEFVPPAMQAEAYEDCALPIPHGQTISQPYTVAFMLQALQLQGYERVLEVGTGSGYAAAVLSKLVREVFTVERFQRLADAARERLCRLGYTNVHVTCGDGTLGWPAGAPYDAILVSASGGHLPQPLREQLSVGGRVVMPVGDQFSTQIMYRFTRPAEAAELESTPLGAFAFVPLIGQHGWRR